MKKILFIALYLLIGFGSYCQNVGFQDIKSKKVDNLTDEEILEFMEKTTKSGFTMEQMEEQALQSGVSAAEWGKLKARVQRLSTSEKKQDYIPAASLSRNAEQQASTYSVETSDGTRIFGSSLFNTANLTFEPNLRLPTPENYKLGPDDELIIEVFGLSEANYKVAVSPEGVIRLHDIGQQIHVSGLTVAQATKLITGKLAASITTISSGETSVSVTLGNIRSIKVIVVGEAFRPGTYTMPSVSSVFNTLNTCGGPNRNGSFRDIKVIRNNKTIEIVDVYDFLLTGEMKNNIQLQDQDVIKIEPYKKRIELKGELKNTGYFDAKGEETLQDMINYAGGFTTNVYRDRATVFRNTEKEKKVSDVAFNDFGSFVVQDGDVFVVGSLLDRFENRVQIAGAVFRPGTYALTPDMTLKQLIEKADGLREDAFLSRGTIIREKENKETEILNFNVNDVVAGKSEIPLKKEDRINIASAIEMKEVQNVAIYGRVKNAGEYRFHENMTLQDLIFAAGGVKDDAELRKIEIYRLEKDPDVLLAGEKISTKHIFTIDKALDGAEFKLEPDDQVVIRFISGYTDVKKVMIEGEVLFPGNYILTSNKERVSDVIRESGGLNLSAYPKGAFLVRKVKTSIAEDIIQQEVIKEVSGEMLDATKFVKDQSIVPINLEMILKNPGSELDLFVEDGDIIRIPKELQTVQVSGEVLYPALVRFDATRSFRGYINRSGGFSSNAQKRKSFVIYANGEIKATKNFLFFHNYPDVTPGAKIYVPIKPERKGGLTTGEAIALSSSFVTMAALIISILRR
ncbi:MAG: SLBB domain-containing protein [Prevotellaceae bacterium]|jgi:protein involved in polysaccharide export with SLBB domain|nr:SLBB domain-containing protein [Prevotellaceae bacterium]